MSEVEDEGRKERIDRELIELLNELRVALPGVQVIFALLLTVPFAQGFSKVDRDQRASYLLTLVALSAASLLLIAPAAQHRVLFRQRDKEELLERSNRYARGGFGALLLAVTLGLFFVLDMVYAGVLAAGVATAAFLAGAWLWIVFPAARRRSSEQVRLPPV